MNFNQKLQTCFLPLGKDAPKSCPQGYSYKEASFDPIGHCLSDSNDCQNLFQQAKDHFCSMTGLPCPASE